MIFFIGNKRYIDWSQYRWQIPSGRTITDYNQQSINAVRGFVDLYLRLVDWPTDWLIKLTCFQSLYMLLVSSTKYIEYKYVEYTVDQANIQVKFSTLQYSSLQNNLAPAGDHHANFSWATILQRSLWWYTVVLCVSWQNEQQTILVTVQVLVSAGIYRSLIFSMYRSDLNSAPENRCWTELESLARC